MPLFDLDNEVIVGIKKIAGVDMASPNVYTVSFYHYFESGSDIIVPDVHQGSVNIPKDKFKEALKYIRDTERYNELFVDGEFLFVDKKLKIYIILSQVLELHLTMPQISQSAFIIYSQFQIVMVK